MISLTNGVQLPENAVKQTVQVAIDKFYASDNIRWIQYDETLPIVAVDLQYEDQHWAIPEGATVRVRMKKPDKYTVLDDALGIDESGIVYFMATRQMTAAWGKGMVVVEVSASGTKNSAQITALIAENPVKDGDIQSTDEYKSLDQLLQEAKEIAKLISDNAANMQLIVDNLEAVQNAGENAIKAEKAAEDAKIAAQQAGGFRTFFSVISPDENGNLDPSRPMTTPSAQASWTIESKGDRIQSVQVNGPGGIQLKKLVITGSTPGLGLRSSHPAGGIAGFVSGAGATPNDTVLATTLPSVSEKDYSENTKNAYVAITSSGSIGFAIPYSGQEKTLSVLQGLLNKSPQTIFFIPTDSGQITGLYVPVKMQGHEYRCQCLPLTEALDAGDNVQSNALSGCDKSVEFDGSSDESWNLDSASVTGASGSKRFYIDLADAIENTSSSVKSTGFFNYLLMTFTNGVYDASKENVGAIQQSTSTGKARLFIRIEGISSVQALRERLSASHLILTYRSTMYDMQNDTSAELETHASVTVSVDGSQSIVANAGSGGYTDRFRVNLGLECKDEGQSAICEKLSYNQYATSENSFWFDKSNMYFRLSGQTIDTISAYLAQNPIAIRYQLATPAIYAHSKVSLVAIPYTSDDSGKTANTYDVSSQDGTTVSVSFKAMQDGGDAKTIDGHSWDDIQKLISDAVASAVALSQ